MNLKELAKKWLMLNLPHDELKCFFTIRIPSNYQSAKFAGTRYVNEYFASGFFKQKTNELSDDFFQEKKINKKENGDTNKEQIDPNAPLHKIYDRRYLGHMPALRYITPPKKNDQTLEEKRLTLQEYILNKEKRPLGIVFTTADYYELASYMVPAATPKDLEEHNIRHIMLPWTDETNGEFSANTIIAFARLFNNYIEEKDVCGLVHCKAGMSRSALMMGSILGEKNKRSKEKLPFNTENAAELEAGIKEKRPCVRLVYDQPKKLTEVLQKLDEISSEPISEETFGWENSSLDLKTRLNKLLSSLQFKNAVIHFTYFKELAIFACSDQGIIRSSENGKNIQAFFTEIYRASSNADWYFALMENGGNLKDILNVNVSKHFICTKFKAQLNEFICDALDCKLKDLLEITQPVFTNAASLKRQYN